MSLPKPTIVIFDMDGTLVRHLNPVVLNLLEIVDDFTHFVGRVKEYLLGRRVVIGPKDPTFEERARRGKVMMHQSIHKIRRKGVNQIVRPSPDIRKTLKFLKQHDVTVALCSNGLGRGYGHDILDAYQLEKYFCATIFAEDIRHKKPHPDPLLKTLKAIGRDLRADDVIWIIGDRDKDIDAAIAVRQYLVEEKAAVSDVVPLSYGVLTSAYLRAVRSGLGKDHLMTNFKEMLGVLKALF